MKTTTVAAGAVTAALVLGGAYAVFELPQRRPHTTATMPKAKRRAPNADGRVYAVIQACTRPAELRAVLHFTIGPRDDMDGTRDLDCREPWTRSGLVQTGDPVILSWAVSPVTTLRGVKYRFTVNNQVVRDSEDSRSAGQEVYRVTGLERG